MSIHPTFAIGQACFSNSDIRQSIIFCKNSASGNDSPKQAKFYVQKLKSFFLFLFKLWKKKKIKSHCWKFIILLFSVKCLLLFFSGYEKIDSILRKLLRLFSAEMWWIWRNVAEICLWKRIKNLIKEISQCFTSFVAALSSIEATWKILFSFNSSLSILKTKIKAIIVEKTLKILFSANETFS